MSLTNKFQFHKGTIKTEPSHLVVLAKKHFNSIKVRLKLPSALPLASCIVNFNSIKVRLKQSQRCRKSDKRSLFQFHKGTIKTVA